MATYADLISDVRGHVSVARQSKSDKFLARTIWNGLRRIVREAADHAPNDHRLPRVIASVSAPADLTDGFAIPTRLKLIAAEAVYDDGSRSKVNVVPPEVRWGYVRPLPAAYVQNDTLECVPGDGYGQIWNHAAMNEAGWKNVASVSFETIAEVAAVTSLTQSIAVDDLFHDAAVWFAASRLEPELFGVYQQERNSVLESLMIQPEKNEAVQDVMGY